MLVCLLQILMEPTIQLESKPLPCEDDSSPRLSDNTGIVNSGSLKRKSRQNLGVLKVQNDALRVLEGDDAMADLWFCELCLESSIQADFMQYSQSASLCYQTVIDWKIYVGVYGVPATLNEVGLTSDTLEWLQNFVLQLDNAY